MASKKRKKNLKTAAKQLRRIASVKIGGLKASAKKLREIATVVARAEKKLRKKG